ncbi:MAG: PLP-dependent cysteine synthase family protein [Planctomycetota bacterium]|nr:PLP-dependent cysteine synthase family protein [Planctomycetota bacterium]
MNALSHLVGNTPMLVLRCKFEGRELNIYAKYESSNFTGSIKDRMALHILRHAYAKGRIQPGDMIVEATSGNTGIAFAGIGRALGHPVRILMPDWMSRERVQIIESFGATVVPISKAEGGFLGSIDCANKYAAENDNVFLPLQFENDANVQAHFMTTGPEIVAQMRGAGVEPTGFVAGVGTGGTVMGVARYLRSEVPAATVHPLEPANSPTLRTGHKVGSHRIQGISDEFIPEIVKLDTLDEIVDVWDGDAILMAQKLATQCGLPVGISSGGNLVGAIKIALEQGEGAAVATVFSDCNKKYLSTDYCNDEPQREDYLTPEIELLGFQVLEPASLSCQVPS